MFKTVSMFFCSLFMCLTLATSAFAGKQDFVFYNDSDYVVDELYVCPVESHDWEEDILGRDVALPGEYFTVSFSRDEKSKLWAILVVTKNGKEFTKEDVNLFSIGEVYFTGKGIRVK